MIEFTTKTSGRHIGRMIFCSGLLLALMMLQPARAQDTTITYQGQVQPGANAWFISELGIRHLQNYENDLNQSRIRMIAAGTLPASEQAKLDKFDKDWRNKKDSGSTFSRHAYVITLARHLTTPMFDDYWKKGNRLWSQDARQYVKWIAEKRHNDDRSVMMGLRVSST